MNRDVRLVQTLYPQIYLACHTSHAPRSANGGVTARDSTLLAHLDERRPTTPSALARHLGIGKPTLSAAVKRLARLGYVRVDRTSRDRRVSHLRLATAGAVAMRNSSVLEPVRVRRLLASLSAAERRAAVEGLSLLARAARRMREGAGDV
jgi:DNA-binding MarR family transcriptional regulator